jgi:membrane protein
MAQVKAFLAHRDVAGCLVFAPMLFFSSLAFTVLENAMSIIFVHRVKDKGRPLWASLLLPYVYILLLGAGFLMMTLIAGLLQAVGTNQIVVLGRTAGLSIASRSFSSTSPGSSV